MFAFYASRDIFTTKSQILFTLVTQSNNHFSLDESRISNKQKTKHQMQNRTVTVNIMIIMIRLSVNINKKQNLWLASSGQHCPLIGQQWPALSSDWSLHKVYQGRCQGKLPKQYLIREVRTVCAWEPDASSDFWRVNCQMFSISIYLVLVIKTFLLTYILIVFIRFIVALIR